MKNRIELGPRTKVERVALHPVACASVLRNSDSPRGRGKNPPLKNGEILSSLYVFLRPPPCEGRGRGIGLRETGRALLSPLSLC
jgi:hypothetical protein